MGAFADDLAKRRRAKSVPGESAVRLHQTNKTNSYGVDRNGRRRIEKVEAMIPFKSPLQLTVPPTLEKQLEALAALRTLQAQDEELIRHRQAAIAALRRDADQFLRDFAAFHRHFEIECSELRRLLKCNADQPRVPAVGNKQSITCASSAYQKAAADDPEHPGWPAGAADGKGGQFRPKDGNGAGSPTDSKGPGEGPAKPRVQYAARETGTQTDASRAPNGSGSSRGAEPDGAAVAQAQPERGARSTAQATGRPTDATEGAHHAIIGAVALNRTTIIYNYDDGSQDVYSGGSLSWRNNNPGNMKAGAGGIYPVGYNEPFAIFPDYQTGFDAMVANLMRPKYQALTIGEAIRTWAPQGDRNDPVAYANDVRLWTGLPSDMPMNVLTTAQIHAVARAIQREEGWRVGTITHLPPPTQYVPPY